ncbi:MAG: GntR family transcriptional regulator [Balneolales bacterium]|nr:GntR family transcriptional regulator [Balneolales bacterium]
MNFNSNQPIYIQIADYFCDQILNRKWTPEERIPSVREIATLMEVNPNTAMRAYHDLQEKGVIVQQRGVGYFATEDAYEKVMALKRDQFIKEELPILAERMKQLGYSIQDLETKILELQHQNGSE